VLQNQKVDVGIEELDGIRKKRDPVVGARDGIAGLLHGADGLVEFVFRFLGLVRSSIDLRHAGVRLPLEQRITVGIGEHSPESVEGCLVVVFAQGDAPGDQVRGVPERRVLGIEAGRPAVELLRFPDPARAERHSGQYV